MGFRFLIGHNVFLPTRARIYRSALLLVSGIVFKSILAFAQEAQFILGRDSIIHRVAINYAQEQTTREALKIKDDCARIKSIATTTALIGSQDASVDARIKSMRGVVVLEGLVNNAGTKTLSTLLLSTYKNYPTVIPGERTLRDITRYPLAVTFAAVVAGTGDLALQRGDSLTIHSDGQLYTYALPPITIPNGGVLRLYAGADDHLYYNAALTHPAHSGSCGGKTK